jgi:3-hydroxyacyl-[acyl-carrier-protein] dehydratase
MEAMQVRETDPVVMDILEIQRWIPHRYPFLLIDRVLDIVPNVHIISVKNVTANEDFFQGHFPGQTAAVFARYSEEVLLSGKTFYLVGADGFKWKKQVVPGDQLRIVMKSVKKRNPLWIMDGEVSVDGKIVASGTLTAAAA